MFLQITVRVRTNYRRAFTEWVKPVRSHNFILHVHGRRIDGFYGSYKNLLLAKTGWKRSPRGVGIFALKTGLFNVRII